MKQCNKLLELVVGCSCFIQSIYPTSPDTSATIRDPFQYYSQHTSTKNTASITLEGVVCVGNKRSAAIIAHGQKREVVQRGECFEGYTLIVLEKDFVVVQRGKIKKKIFIK